MNDLLKSEKLKRSLSTSVKFPIRHVRTFKQFFKSFFFEIVWICGPSAWVSIKLENILAWNSGRIKNDISLLKLKSPIDFSPGVQPIHLPAPTFRSDKDSPQRTDIQSQVNGPVCLISGFGTIKFQGSPPDMLQQATVPLVTRNGLWPISHGLQWAIYSVR